MKEIWKDAVGFEELYSISNCGKVFSKKYKRLKKLAHGTAGYCRMSLCMNGKSKFHALHRLVAINFIPNPENKPCVNHIDGDKENNRVDNLEWCTHKENSQHAARIGRFNREGKRHGKIVITERDIHHIRYMYANTNITQVRMAELYGVEVRCIYNIVKRKTWKHIH